MPATRITIGLNAKQSQKAPLLLPASASLDPSSPNSCHSLVIKATQSKLRLRKVSRIFVAGTGQELCTELDWNGALKDDITLLASAGEEYVGLRKESAIHGEFVLRYGTVHQAILSGCNDSEPLIHTKIVVIQLTSLYGKLQNMANLSF